MHSGQFQVGDGPAVVALWCRSMPADPVTYQRFRDLVLLDANFDPAGLRLAWDGDALIGAAYAVRRRVAMVGGDLEPARGWLPFFFVAPQARRRGVARRLLTDALEWLRTNGCREVSFASYTPNYFLPGCDTDAYPAAAALLRSLGFATWQVAAAMDRSLVGYAMPGEVADRIAARQAEGWRFGTPAGDELPALAAIAGTHFSADWARVIRESVVGGLPLDRIVVARHPDEGLTGWAMYGAYRDTPDRFGPFGVLPQRQGGGIGRILLHLTLTRMRALGLHSAWFLWTGEQTAAGRLYRTAAFTTTRRFDVMRATL